MSLLPGKSAAVFTNATAKADPKRRALGRGLEALLPALPTPLPTRVALEASAEPAADGKPLDIAVEAIERNPFQTRTTFDAEKLMELAQSIAVSGVVQPVIVRDLGGGRYQLIAGERRLLASKQAGKETIPAIVRAVSDEQAMEMTIVENLQRADLNPIEQARAYHRLSTEFRLTQEQMAIRTGKDRASVGNFLRLIKLPEAVQHQVETGVLSFGHAKVLLALPTPEAIAGAAQKVLALSLSVRQTESYVQGLLYPELRAAKVEKPIVARDPNVGEAESRLRRALGLKVKIEDKKGKGRVIIEYSGLEDFDAIMEALNAQAQE